MSQKPSKLSQNRAFSQWHSRLFIIQRSSINLGHMYHQRMDKSVASCAQVFLAFHPNTNDACKWASERVWCHYTNVWAESLKKPPGKDDGETKGRKGKRGLAERNRREGQGKKKVGKTTLFFAAFICLYPPLFFFVFFFCLFVFLRCLCSLLFLIFIYLFIFQMRRYIYIYIYCNWKDRERRQRGTSKNAKGKKQKWARKGNGERSQEGKLEGRATKTMNRKRVCCLPRLPSHSKCCCLSFNDMLLELLERKKTFACNRHHSSSL